MSEISAAATNIYNRLASAPIFHPASADLFTDWNVQAGDVVTVKSDSDSYQVPLYNMKLKWTGAPRVEIESTGNPEREPLPAIKRREYSANSNNYKEQKSLRGGVSQAQSGVVDINGVLHAAGLEIDPVTGVWLYASEQGANYALGATFSVQAGQISAKADSSTVEALGTRVTTAEFNIDASAGTISQIVSNIGSNGEVTEASIVLAVNRASNKSSITLNASQIYLEGNTVAQKITGVEAQIGNIKNGSTICNQLTTQSIKVNGSYHHNSQITIDGVTYNIVTWGGSY